MLTYFIAEMRTSLIDSFLEQMFSCTVAERVSFEDLTMSQFITTFKHRHLAENITPDDDFLSTLVLQIKGVILNPSKKPLS